MNAPYHGTMNFGINAMRRPFASIRSDHMSVFVLEWTGMTRRGWRQPTRATGVVSSVRTEDPGRYPSAPPPSVPVCPRHTDVAQKRLLKETGPFVELHFDVPQTPVDPIPVVPKRRACGMTNRQAMIVNAHLHSSGMATSASLVKMQNRNRNTDTTESLQLNER